MNGLGLEPLFFEITTNNYNYSAAVERRTLT
jgi:hypothetical protein